MVFLTIALAVISVVFAVVIVVLYSKLINTIDVNDCPELRNENENLKTIVHNISESNFEKLKEKIIIWANERNLLNSTNAKSQLLKTVEELGELSKAELENNRDMIVDSLGDVLVTLIIYSQIKGIGITSALSIAYNEIKNRKGKTENGTFIKEK